MEDTYEHIDLTTLQEVERLLTTTEFATIDDLAERFVHSAPSGAGVSMPVRPSGGSVMTVAPDVVGGEATAPLPKRR